MLQQLKKQLGRTETEQNIFEFPRKPLDSRGF